MLEITLQCKGSETAPWKIQNIQLIIRKPIRQNGHIIQNEEYFLKTLSNQPVLKNKFILGTQHQAPS